MNNESKTKWYHLEYKAPEQKFNLKNLPPLTEPSGWVIEQNFLRHITTGVIPHLDQYLQKLNEHDWTCLLTYNPRQEFLHFLHEPMKSKLDWDYILKYQPELGFSIYLGQFEDGRLKFFNYKSLAASSANMQFV